MSSVLAGTATSITFVCWNKIRLLSRQKYACHNKTFVTTNYVHWYKKHMFVVTSFVTTKGCCYKRVFVVTIFLSRQNYVCCEKYFLWQKTFVATMFFFFSQLAYFCRDKNDTCGSSANDRVQHTDVHQLKVKHTKFHSHQLSPLSGQSTRLMTERLWVWVPAGAVQKISSPGSTFCADSYFGIQFHPCVTAIACKKIPVILTEVQMAGYS